ncbi:MAG: NAD-dependent deacylase [Mariniblastus sp.]|nr:NAD-dependent deacylase [Mariniblastus sp.]
MHALSEFDHEINQVADILKSSSDIFVVTGAGISADSGLPTYRGFGGLYDQKETEDGIPIEKALSGPMFESNPQLTWKYLAEIEEGARGAKHNRAHEVLAEMEQKFKRFWILTQNIDGFHTTAGSKNVIEIHGNMHRMICSQCPFNCIYADYSNFKMPPLCPDCSSMIRPDVVLFEEQLPPHQINVLYRETEKPFDLVISIGTTSYFPYIAEPIYQARQMGIPTVEINPGRTEVSGAVDIKLPLRAAETLNEIWHRYQSA